MHLLMESRWWHLIVKWNSWKWLAVTTMPSKTCCRLKYKGFNGISFKPSKPTLYFNFFFFFTNPALTGWFSASLLTIQRRCVASVWSLGYRWKHAEVFWSGLKNWALMWLVSAFMLAAGALTQKPTPRQLLMLAVCLILGWVGNFSFPPYCSMCFKKFCLLEWTGV